MQLFRTVADYIYESWSIDNGVTWSNATALSLENPNSKVKWPQCMRRRALIGGIDVLDTIICWSNPGLQP
jgi:hypothetical protein